KRDETGCTGALRQLFLPLLDALELNSFFNSLRLSDNRGHSQEKLCRGQLRARGSPPCCSTFGRACGIGIFSVVVSDRSEACSSFSCSCCCCCLAKAAAMLLFRCFSR